MDEWRQYIETRTLRDQWEDRVVSCRQRLRNADLNSTEGRSLRQELAIYQTVLDDFVTRLGLG